MTTNWYVNRWYDDDGVPHYFGLASTQPTIEDANKYIKFNVIAVPVDIVYGPCSEADMHEYMADMQVYFDGDVPETGMYDLEMGDDEDD